MATNTSDLKTRNWFITINKGAKCYQSIDSTSIKSLPYIHNWYMITHKVGQAQEHKHVVITTKNAIRFASVQDMFQGANIEVSKDINASVQYLTHKNNLDKEQYQFDVILTNNPVQLKKLYNELSKELFDANEILKYYEEGCTSFIAFYKRFGANIAKSQSLIKNVLQELEKNNGKTIDYIDRRLNVYVEYIERLKRDKALVLSASELLDLEDKKEFLKEILKNENDIK